MGWMVIYGEGSCAKNEARHLGHLVDTRGHQAAECSVQHTPKQPLPGGRGPLRQSSGFAHPKICTYGPGAAASKWATAAFDIIRAGFFFKYVLEIKDYDPGEA